MKQTIKVPDMMCKHCAKKVTTALEGLGVTEVEIDLDAKTATYACDALLDATKLEGAIQAAGFTFAGICD